MSVQDAPQEVRDLTGLLTPELQLQEVDLARIVPDLAAYHARFAPLFARAEQRAWAAVYLRGLLTADVPRKNIEAMALRLLGAGPGAEHRVRALQHFVGEGAWDDAALLAEHQRCVEETLGEDDGVLIIDGSDIPKQGTHSAGVARQWCGATGKKDTCQAGVFLAYASHKGATLLDRRLYLPALWFTDEYAERWRVCAIPPHTRFQTKHELAGDLVEQVVGGGRLRARWATCDEGFGDDPVFLDRVTGQGLLYLAEVPCDTQVWPLQDPATGQPRPQPQVWVPPQTASRKGPAPRRPRLQPKSPPKMRVEAIAAQLPATAWQRYRILEGSKGPLVADFAAVRALAVRDRLPGPEVWVVLRRKVSGHPDVPVLKHYRSNASADTPLDTLVWVSGMRWPIESCFSEGKGEVGLDHYELRFWPGWHHHMTLVFLAHHFLVQLQARLDQRGGGPRHAPAPPRSAAAHDGASPAAALRSGSRGLPPARARPTPQRGRGAPPAVRSAAPPTPHPVGGAGPAVLSTAAQAGRLSLASQAPAAPAC